MSSREELQEAYSAFRLPIGSDWKTIKKRYKLLVKAWHPDKQGGKDKEDVQQELKEYNNFYNDVFKKHFESEHSDSLSCACQPLPDIHQEPTQEEFQEQESQFQSSPEPVEPIDPEIEARSQRRRWQASGLCAIVFIAILAYGYIGSKIRSMVPVSKTEVTNSAPITPVSEPAGSSSGWRAPYQSISTPITQSPGTVKPAQSNQNLDDVRRNIVAKENRMQLLQQSIDSLKAQISLANPSSAGMLNRDRGNKEAEMKILQQDVYYLKMQLNQ